MNEQLTMTLQKANKMKRIFVILTTLLVCLNSHAQMNPVIDSLVRNAFIMKLGTSDFDKNGMRIRRSGITYQRADFKQPVNYRNVEEREKELNAMRDACRMLSKNAKESYLWESHEGGKDTLMYILTLNNDTCRETLKLMYTDRNVRFITLDEDGTSELKPKGAYEFEYCIENGDNQDNHFVDVEELNRRIAHLWQDERIESHDLYIRHDKSYPTSSKGMDYISTATNIQLWFDSETRGTLYTIPTKELGDRIFLELGEIITQYYKENPHVIHYGSSVIPQTYDAWQMDLVHSQIMDFTGGNKPWHEYRIIFYPPGNKKDGICRILVEETTGALWLPEGWQRMKSWVNGKATYYKK